MINKATGANLCTMHEAADYLGIGYPCFIRLVKASLIPFYSPYPSSKRQRKYFKTADLDAYLSRNAQPSNI